jgi:hypothetical protein
MTKDQIKAVLDRVLTWPAEAQAEAVASLGMIEEEFSHPLSADDERALERSADDVGHIRFASETEVRDVFERFLGQQSQLESPARSCNIKRQR